MTQDRKEYMKAWRAKNPDYYQRTKKARLQSQYKWAKKNRDKFNAIRIRWMLKKRVQIAGRPQAAECEICLKPGPVVFDHCHNTGQFRGWICTRCNTALGFACDNPSILRRMANYLEACGGHQSR